VAFLSLPFITLNHAAYILNKDTNTFTRFEVKKIDVINSPTRVAC